MVVEGNHYIPAKKSIKKEFLKPSDWHTSCPWKGMQGYYHIEGNGSENRDTAWYYPETSDLAKAIKGKVAFWGGVQIED